MTYEVDKSNPVSKLLGTLLL